MVDWTPVIIAALGIAATASGFLLSHFLTRGREREARRLDRLEELLAQVAAYSTVLYHYHDNASAMAMSPLPRFRPKSKTQ